MDLNEELILKIVNEQLELSTTEVARWVELLLKQDRREELSRRVPRLAADSVFPFLQALEHKGLIKSRRFGLDGYRWTPK